VDGERTGGALEMGGALVMGRALAVSGLVMGEQKARELRGQAKHWEATHTGPLPECLRGRGRMSHAA